MKQNYQLILDNILNQIKEKEEVPSLLLHTCCAPCSSYVLEYLSEYFNITIYYYNPNINTYEEFKKRADEQLRLISEMNFKNPVKCIITEYNNDEFENVINGFEDEPEGGSRCFKCYHLRLEEACIYAKKHNFDYFTTSLSISPYKNSDKLNEIGESLEQQYNIKYLYADFKKKDGYKRSIELSKIYNLYRQDYCGCIYSKKSKEDLNEKEYS